MKSTIPLPNIRKRPSHPVLKLCRNYVENNSRQAHRLHQTHLTPTPTPIPTPTPTPTPTHQPPQQRHPQAAVDFAATTGFPHCRELFSRVFQSVVSAHSYSKRVLSKDPNLSCYYCNADDCTAGDSAIETYSTTSLEPTSCNTWSGRTRQPLLGASSIPSSLTTQLEPTTVLPATAGACFQPPQEPFQATTGVGTSVPHWQGLSLQCILSVESVPVPLQVWNPLIVRSKATDPYSNNNDSTLIHPSLYIPP